MRSRFLAAFLVAVAAGAMTASAGANPFYDPDGRFSGGRTTGGGFGGLFGRSSTIARTTVTYPSRLPYGSIVINTTERRLYLILGNGLAIRYGVGVGRAGFTWSGVKHVSAKREWPAWTPPAQMRRRRPDLPGHMAGGVENPLGARAMYLGSSLYRIHGSNEPETIGQAVSSGCFRLTNEDIVDLYNRVRVGAKVVVLRH
jgi:lipoprotein-anchoring transpeptidase ErfK/SrfK